MPPKPTSYDLVHVDGGSAARLSCYRCDAVVEVSVKPRSSREHIGILFRNKGWDFDATTKRLCLCPVHAKRKKSRKETDLGDGYARLSIPLDQLPEGQPLFGLPRSEKHARELTAHLTEALLDVHDAYVDRGLIDEPPQPEPEFQQFPEVPPQQVADWIAGINDEAGVQPVATPEEGTEQEMKPILDIVPTTAEHLGAAHALPGPRALTPAEKAKVRDKLDLHYDTDRCCYINGWSDQKIGTDAKVPWAAVAQMREMAYGPLLVDPETEALSNELKRLDAQIEEGSTQLLELMGKIDELKKQAGLLQKQVDALALTRRK